MGYNLQICRLCVESENLQRIFGNTLNLHHPNTSIALQQKIQYALNIIVDPTDASEMICITCVNKVERMYAFRLQALEVQQFLNGVTSILSPTVAPEKITEYYKKMKKTINRSTSLVYENLHPSPSKEVAIISDQEVASATTESMDTTHENNIPLYSDDSFNDDPGSIVKGQEIDVPVSNITSTSKTPNSSSNLDMSENKMAPASKFPIDIYGEAFENKLTECIKSLSSDEREDKVFVIDQIIAGTGVLTYPTVQIDTKEFIDEVSSIIIKILLKCEKESLPNVLTNKLDLITISNANELQETDENTEEQVNNTTLTKQSSGKDSKLRKALKKIHKCNYCHKMFKYSIQLHTHVKKSHKFRCIYCSLSYRDKSGLTHHIRKYKCFSFKVERDGKTLTTTSIDPKLNSKPAVYLVDCMNSRLSSNHTLPPTPPVYLVGRKSLNEEEKTNEKINQKIYTVNIGIDRSMKTEQIGKSIKLNERKVKENLAMQKKSIQNALRNIDYVKPQNAAKNTSEDSFPAPIIHAIQNSKELDNRCLLNNQENTIEKTTNLTLNAAKTLDEATNLNCVTSQSHVKSSATNVSIPPPLQAMPNTAKIFNRDKIRNKTSNTESAIPENAVKSSAPKDSVPPPLQAMPNAAKIFNRDKIFNKTNNTESASNDFLQPPLQAMPNAAKIFNRDKIFNKTNNTKSAIPENVAKSSAPNDFLQPPLQAMPNAAKIFNRDKIFNKTNNTKSAIPENVAKSSAPNDFLQPPLQPMPNAAKIFNRDKIFNKTNNTESAIPEIATKSSAPNDFLQPPLQAMPNAAKIFNRDKIFNKTNNTKSAIPENVAKSSAPNDFLQPPLQAMPNAAKIFNRDKIFNKTNNTESAIPEIATKSSAPNDFLQPPLQAMANAAKIFNRDKIFNKTNNTESAISENAAKSSAPNDFLQPLAVQQQSKQLTDKVIRKELELKKINEKIKASKIVMADMHKLVRSNKTPTSNTNKFKIISKIDNLNKTNLKRPHSGNSPLKGSLPKMLKLTDIQNSSTSTLNVEVIQNENELIKDTQPPKILTTPAEISEQTLPVTSQPTTEGGSSGAESTRPGIRVKPLALLQDPAAAILPKTPIKPNSKSCFKESLRCPVEIIYDYKEKNDDDNSKNIHCKICVAVTENNESVDRTTLKKYPSVDSRDPPQDLESITATFKNLLDTNPKTIRTHSSSTGMTQDIAVSKPRHFVLKKVPSSNKNVNAFSIQHRSKIFRPNSNTSEKPSSNCIRTKIVQTISLNGIETTKLVQPGDKHRPAVLLNGNDGYSFQMSGNSINIRDIEENRTTPIDTENEKDISSPEDLVEVYCVQNGKNNSEGAVLSKEDNITVSDEDCVEIVEPDGPICISSDEEKAETATVLERNKKFVRSIPVVGKDKEIPKTMPVSNTNNSSLIAPKVYFNSKKLNDKNTELLRTDTPNIFRIHSTMKPTETIHQGHTKNHVGWESNGKTGSVGKLPTRNYKLIIKKQLAEVQPPNVKRSNEECLGVERAIETISGGDERPNVERFNAEQANVEQTNVERANVERPNVEWANVERPNVERFNAEQANVEQANVKRANVERPNVERANVERPNVERANEELCNKERPHEEPANLELNNKEVSERYIEEQATHFKSTASHGDQSQSTQQHLFNDHSYTEYSIN